MQLDNGKRLIKCEICDRTTKFHKLNKKRIMELSEEYDSTQKDRYGDPDISKNGVYLTKKDFITIAKWKTARWVTDKSIKNLDRNDEKFVEEVTEIAFCPDTSEELRIGILTLLRGVRYPVASALLHWGLDAEEYPIIDFRALWSLWKIMGLETEEHGFYRPCLWVKYRKDCIELAKKKGVSLRDLDKALWQYSDDKQPSRKEEKIEFEKQKKEGKIRKCYLDTEPQN